MIDQIRLKSIGNKLEKLRQEDTEFRYFGASVHRYKLGAPREVAQIEVFEKQHGITLPTNYRDFLVSVGSGGAGPGYGLFTLDEWNTHLTNRTSQSILQKDFQFTKPWQPDKDYLENEMDGFEYPDELLSGTITLNHYGCGIFAILVVAGIERGNVWVSDLDGDNGIYPIWHEPYTLERLDFLTWYERWLDREDPMSPAN